jgi:hypothetical protein
MFFMIECPRCKSQVDGLQAVEPGLLAKLKEMGEAGLSSQVCLACISELSTQNSEPPAPLGEATNSAAFSGGVLMAQEKAKEEHRIALWKSRVQLIKAARIAMTGKHFAEAALAYEKYLKILEVVFDVKKGDLLRPEIFKERARTTELTVVTSVYWDLLRIYDTQPKYQERMQAVSRQLASFAPFTPIFNDIARRAESFSRSAKNPNIVKQFLKLSGKEKSKCFIATSAFGPASIEVQELRKFRDGTLKSSSVGRRFILFYYSCSPKFALFLDKHSWFKPAVRTTLRLLIKCVS